MTAADLLGQTHPLTRASRRFDTACLQLLSGLTILVAIVLFAHGPGRRLEVVVGAATCVAISGLAAGAFCSRRRHARELILAGYEDLPLDALVPIRRRLDDPRRREQLAASLERYLRSARRWHQTAPPMRPIGNAPMLLPFEDDVRTIALLLRADTVSHVRGVALCACLLTDGTRSPLYGTDADALRRELGRIRFSLDAR
jgi:hypothetical protein